MPETAAGRTPTGFVRLPKHTSEREAAAIREDVHALIAEARALGRAEALAAAGHAVSALAGFHPGEDGDLVLRSSVLAAIDNLETPDSGTLHPYETPEGSHEPAPADR